MPLPKIRELGKFGVIADVDPYDLPPQAFSFACNVRFRNGKLTSGPVYRRVLTTGTSSPRYVGAYNPNSGLNAIYIGYKNGRVKLVQNSAETDKSIAGYVDSDSSAVWTDVKLADVFYVNREDRVPWFLTSAASQFAVLTNWDSTWRTRLLRKCGGALVALNVTKGATNYPTMVKTSSIPTSGVVPSSWDHTVPSTNATENILAEMESPIVDAGQLGSDLWIFGASETWKMVADGSDFVFQSQQAYKGRGAINANCNVEVDGVQYVFGVDDIWMHDGVTPMSAVDGTNRDFIYDNLDATKFDQCFVTYNAQLREVRFHYFSGDSFAKYPGATGGCNRVAVLSLTNKTWTFDDAPLVRFGASGHVSDTLTYATVSGTYTTIGGSYADLDGNSRRTLLYVGDTVSAYSLTQALYGFDKYGAGSGLTYAVDEVATTSRYAERSGIDLDELDKDLRGYATVSSVYPQGRIADGAGQLQFSFGSGDYFGDIPQYAAYQTYGGSEYKIDPNTAGRFLAMRILHDDYRGFSLSGLDLDVVVDGDR